MKAKELKIGDIVSFLGNLTKVHSIDPPAIYVIDEDNIIWGTNEINNDITPIPLTEEILEKNGWCWDERNCDWRLAGLAIAPYELNGKEHMAVYAYSNQDLVNIYDSDYAHELQHLLWALGIDDDLKI